MARNTAQVLAQLERFLPPRYASIRPVLGGIAAIFAAAESTGENFATATTVGGATGVFLTLRAAGFGIYPTPGESEASIRSRIRNVEGQITRPAILAAVNALLAEFTEEVATMIEPKDDGFFDVDFWYDTTIYTHQYNGFILLVPHVGDEVDEGFYFDSEYFDGDTYFGAGVEHPVYLAIIALVERIRAAGIRWVMHIDR